MKITVFTGNQPRHLSLIHSLAKIADEVYAVQECNTVFPGKIKDFFNNSPTMQDYFSRVIAAEHKVFGNIGFSPNKVHSMSLKSEDLNLLPLQVLEPALHSDVYVVFGASYIKGDLIEFLVEHKALNIHMGVSPYYRGSSCNFWAPFEGHPELVGATIHLLSRGLDSGDMLYHALPAPCSVEPFELGMISVKVAHDSLVDRIASKEIFSYVPVPQDKTKLMKYTRNSDFTDDVAKQYLENLPTENEIMEKLQQRNTNMLYHPFITL